MNHSDVDINNQDSDINKTVHVNQLGYFSSISLSLCMFVFPLLYQCVYLPLDYMGSFFLGSSPYSHTNPTHSCLYVHGTWITFCPFYEQSQWIPSKLTWQPRNIAAAFQRLDHLCQNNDWNMLYNFPGKSNKT